MESNSFESFFHDAYMPHGHCYLWQPHLLWGNVISDLLIATAYFSIPIAIMIFAKKRPDVGGHWLFVLFSSFILLCGLTHLIGIYTVWQGAYGMHALAKMATALVSITTAVYMFRLIPSAIAIPTPNQFQGVSRKLDKVTQEKHQLDSKLAEHELTHFILNTLPASIVVLDNTFKITQCNPHFLRTLDLCDTQLNGQSLNGLIEFSDPFTTIDTLAHKLSNAESAELSTLCHVTTQANSTIPMEMKLVKAQFEGQSVVLALFNNLSTLKNTERALKESDKKMRRAINATADGIWEWNVVTGEVSYSPRLMAMIGKANIEHPGYEDWFEHIHPEHRQRVEQAIEQHFKSKEQYQVEYQGRNEHGEYSWFMAVGNSQFDEQGKPLLMSGALRNIDSSKMLERKVSEKTNILNAIYNGASQAIWLLQVEEDGDFTFLEFNPTACQRASIKLEDIQFKRLSELRGKMFDDQILNHIQDNYQTCCELKKPLEYIEMLPTHGQELWYQTTLYPLLDSHGNVKQLVGTAIDITARKYAEAELRDSQQFLQRIIDSAVCGLYLFDLTQQTNVKINRRYTHLLGYTLQELENCNLMELFHPQERPLLDAHMKEVVSSQSGDLIPLKYRFKHKQGHWVWCYSLDTIVTRDEQGNPELMLGTFVDITEQTNLLRELQESNASLEHFAFIASHDLQEPLRKISAFSDSLSLRLAPALKEDDKACFEMDRLLDATQRMRTMIQDLLKLSRLNAHQLKLTRVSLNSLITEACDQLSFIIEESHAQIECDNPDCELEVDASLFIQVWQNLIANSIKFCADDKAPCVRITIQREGTTLMLHYQDNGIGVPEQFRQQIFEPFRRLHGDSHKGSGIGLSLCKKIVDLHGGQITCIDSEHAGAHFVITLKQREL
ncbi:PAS domain-containing protein [Pseudoalteromonas rubra]|uniref:histidine kinase n=1 Tax=Pseudoalteromonas rubra TaxID=43658 RepID=A0A5S3X0L2_9GAMM|nr:PAS domain-containing protein [Pseudoalteromonas rubra]TMP37456.1 PAS domain-containing sensor histidine kinase [Pseudoalteromonas rubra]